ncbi:unnamed protein product [Pseudo-nitzschia multistriata]|uniref:Uncharacterized protein n=1 Tax=Pseudo-nitzschia multistriata TaxID=183589 RepID=A0A448ZSY1_9STRA|nr:unnamed protein product [Pseudo-nitzschia multistriata]
MSFIASIKRFTVDIPLTVLNGATAIGVITTTTALLLYWRSIEKHKEEFKSKLARSLVYRDPDSKSTKAIKILELHPDFVREHSSSWQLKSLGQYLSTLRFITEKTDDKSRSDGDKNEATEKESNSRLVQALERELYVLMAALLMKTLGETMGAVFLPVMGSGQAESIIGAVSSKIVHYIMAQILVDSRHTEDWDPTEDRAAMPLNVSEVISFVNLNQKLTDGNQMSLSPLQWMQKGEIGYNPTYDTPITSGDEGTEQPPVLVPNPFVVEEHFEKAIAGMEDRIRGSGATYDPSDRSHPEPVPINNTILPDLHMGWGDAKVTHTKREVLCNRLFAVLLTKLSYNYELRKTKKTDNIDDDSGEPYFVVQMDGKNCVFPDQFVEVLYDTGHSIEVCPRSTITTFGLAACVKEKDGSWTNIPLAFFFRTGYESSHRRPAYFHPLHGGIDLSIEGALVGNNKDTGEPRKCDIQFYMAIEGMCGWQSNHNPDVPWIERVSTCDPYTREQALAAVRMSGIMGCTFNRIGTDMDLPFGGYGVLGVCNDTAALIDRAVRGSTNMYPLLSTGRYLMHITRFLMAFHDTIAGADEHGAGAEGDGDCCKTHQIASDTLRLVSAACSMESDIHCAPHGMAGAARRYRSNYPRPFFQITDDSQSVMDEIAREYEDLETTVQTNIP